MRLDILTRKEALYSGEVELVQFPGISGSFEILQNHIPIISLLVEGKIKIIEKNGKEDLFIPIASGIVEFADNVLTVLVEQ